MQERPILFNAEMVNAILDGRKTQTRRVIKLPHNNIRGDWEPSAIGGRGVTLSDGSSVGEHVAIWHTRTGNVIGCPFGQVGDRLWVRETWATQHKYDHLPPRLIPLDANMHYAASEERGGLLWRPSIHMPRWASRITLEITNVRVERLQDISEDDARAEGIVDGGCLNCGESEPCGCDNPHPDATDTFAGIWESIHGPYTWIIDPWVWVIEFKRITSEAQS